ncbi:MAG TPA: NAD(P)/FAD-dependent oxidoreductase [Burkholderiaceae bacterium]
MKIAIVGGGLAGIAAATQLLESGPEDLTVHLFEASGRLGGRAFTDLRSIRGFAFDMGAQYLQDPKENPLVAIAEELGFETVEEDAEYLLRVDKGNGWVDEETTTPDVQAVVDRIQASFDRASRVDNQRVAPQPRHDTQVELLGHATSTYGPFTESAEVWQYVAADRARERVLDAGANRFVKRGVGTLVAAYGARLATGYPKRFTAHMDTPVTGIAQADGQVGVGSGPREWTFDACIVTVPVSVLARGAIAFSPALPAGHRDALRVLRLGSYKKLALALKTSPRDIVPGTNYYLVNDEPAGVWQVYRLPYAPDVLVAHAAGDFAAKLDQMRDADVYEMFGTLVREAFDGVFFTSGKAITGWSDAPYAGGAYSYTAFNGGGPEDPGPLAARTTLAKPVGRVHFAGEALDPACYGTLQAAYFTGVEAALQVLG